MIYVLFISAHKITGRTTESIIITPPIVGVPSFSLCVCGPNSLIVSPICLFLKNFIIRGPTTKAKNNAVIAASEDLNERDFTLNQINSFKKTSTELIDKLGYTPMRHMTNTSGILNYPEAHFDMVRTGIGLYGFGNSAKENENLKPIATLKSVISQIHIIEKGESVGYNRAHKSSELEKTATIPIGHADGISRIYGNRKGYVFINGKKALIIGNVCMDMLMVNITDIECKEGDEVIVFDSKNTAETLAENVGTISYELLSDVSQRIKRVFCR